MSLISLFFISSEISVHDNISLISLFTSTFFNLTLLFQKRFINTSSLFLSIPLINSLISPSLNKSN